MTIFRSKNSFEIQNKKLAKLSTGYSSNNRNASSHINQSISYNYNSVFLPNRMRDMMNVSDQYLSSVKLPSISISHDLKTDLRRIQQDNG